MNTSESQNYTILGQKYAYATVSLLLGIFCFVNLAGMEKAILAILFGWLALRKSPAPALKEHRIWAKTGMILGSLVLIIVPTIIILNFDRLREFIEVLSKMSSGK
ncbi:MAG: hypothetical protein LC768_15855 [Acidobacteria bacterium]|nr:hypothetical protein [Acidobacteriota bacterium]MCA1639775.1 hypothetical protein [Acidobacteriota bacterium]